MINFRKVVMDFLNKRDGNICTICKQEFSDIGRPEIDHLKPTSLNGSDDIENLRLVHTSCHRKRNHRFKDTIKITEYMRKRPLFPNKNKIRDEIAKKYLLILKEEFIKTGSLKEACVNIGWSYRQGRYLIFKCELPGDPRLWNLT